MDGLKEVCMLVPYIFMDQLNILLKLTGIFIRCSLQVHFVLFADDIYDVWVKKANQLLKA